VKQKAVKTRILSLLLLTTLNHASALPNFDRLPALLAR
jgi:hypothetical protein